MIELRELTFNDGPDIYEMLREIGPGENGFVNEDPGADFGQFTEFLLKRHNMAKGLDLPQGWVPMTTFWLVVDGKPVGIGRLRHYLNDYLRKLGGHIGYSIRPSERGKGYGNIILRELLVKAKDGGIPEVLITCDETNIRSRSIIAANGFTLYEIKEGHCHWWKGLSE